MSSPGGLVGCLIAAAFVPSRVALPADLASELLFDDSNGERCSLELLQVSTREVRHPKDNAAQLISQKYNIPLDVPLAHARLKLLGRNNMYGRSTNIDHRQWPELDGPEAYTWDVPEPVKIVAWTGQFYVTDGIMDEFIPQCTFEYLSTHKSDFPADTPTEDTEFIMADPDTDISDADVVLFYLPYLVRNVVLPQTKREGQLWIATCGEPVFRPETKMDCRLLNDTSVMSQMDGVASYHGSSEFPTYNDPPYEWMMRQEIPDFDARGPEIVSFALSDCRSATRANWLGAVMDRFAAQGRGEDILSYGHCFHNAEEPDKEHCEQRWFDWWTNRCASRPFKLVAENTVEPWYITEKLWDAFVEGSIPVYFGPKEVKELVPPDSVLYAGDYESPEALADALMSFSKEDFERARAWKQLPTSEWGGYEKARRNSHTTLLPRLCEAGAAAKRELRRGQSSESYTEIVQQARPPL